MTHRCPRDAWECEQVAAHKAAMGQLPWMVIALVAIVLAAWRWANCR